MASLTNQTILSTYQSLLKTSSNGNLTTSLLQISDGLGNNSPLYLSTTLAAVNSNLLVGTTTDSGYKLDVNGTARVQTSLQISGASDGAITFPTTVSGQVMKVFSQYGSNALVVWSNGYNLNLNGGGGMTSNFVTTITGSNGSPALTVQQGNVAWTPVLKVNAIGSTGTQFNTNGNVLIGTTTDAGYKLDVNGDLRVINNGVIGNASAFSGGFAGLMSIRKDLDVTAGGTYRNGQLAIGSASNNGALVLGYSTSGAGTIQAAVLGVAFSPLTIQAYGGNVLIGTTTDIASSILTLQSTTKGFLPPRMTNAQRTAISSPAIGLIVYCTDATEGLYIYKSTGWTFVI
jgi:hypothetical protein